MLQQKVDTENIVWYNVIIMNDSHLRQDRCCDKCNPLVVGWCSYVENTKGLMLDEKCPKVAKFIKSVLKESNGATGS